MPEFQDRETAIVAVSLFRSRVNTEFRVDFTRFLWRSAARDLEIELSELQVRADRLHMTVLHGTKTLHETVRDRDDRELLARILLFEAALIRKETPIAQNFCPTGNTIGERAEMMEDLARRMHQESEAPTEPEPLVPRHEREWVV